MEGKDTTRRRLFEGALDVRTSIGNSIGIKFRISTIVVHVLETIIEIRPGTDIRRRRRGITDLLSMVTTRSRQLRIRLSSFQKTTIYH